MQKESSYEKIPNVVESLFSRVISGGFWVLFLRISSESLGMIRLLILARLLAPNDFGLMGIVLLVTGIFGKVIDSGFEGAVLQRKDGDVNRYLNVAWTAQVFRGIFIGSLLYVTAPLVADFFHEPQVKNIIKLFALSQVIMGFNNIGIIYFDKNLEFKKYFTFAVLPKFIELIVTVILAFILRNVWALIIGLLIRVVVTLIFSYIVHPYRPNLEFTKQKYKELFGYSKWLVGQGITNFLLMQGDDFLVGKLLGATSLGFYQIAYRLSNLPATEISHLISRVTFPAYAKMQDQKQRLKESYLKVLSLTALLSLPIAAIIYALASDITLVFLTEKWRPIIPVMQILVVWGAIRSLDACCDPLFKAIFRPDLILKLQLAQLILIAIFIYPLSIKYNILGTAITITGASLCISPFTHFLSMKMLKYRISSFVKIFFPSLGAALFSVFALWGFKKIFIFTPSFVLLVLQVILQMIVYLISSYLFDILFKGTSRFLIRDFIKGLKKTTES